MKRSLTSLVRPVTFAILALAPILFLSARARADDGALSDPSARAASVVRVSEEGLALYKDRDYRRAAERFLQAYAIEPDPNLLFNMARCYEAMGDREGAIEKYETFLSKVDADPQGKRRATDALRSLRQGKQRSTLAESSAGGVSDPGRTTIVPSPEREAPSLPDLFDARDPPPPVRVVDHPNRRGVAPMVVLGVGVLAAAVGAVAYGMGTADHNKVTGSPGYGMAGEVDPMTESEARRLVDSGDTKRLLGGISMGLGGALLVTSALLYMSGGTRGDARAGDVASLAFGMSPSPLGGGGQIFLRRTFR